MGEVFPAWVIGCRLPQSPQLYVVEDLVLAAQETPAHTRAHHHRSLLQRVDTGIQGRAALLADHDDDREISLSWNAKSTRRGINRQQPPRDLGRAGCGESRTSGSG